MALSGEVTVRIPDRSTFRKQPPKLLERRCKEQIQHENQSSSEKENSGEISSIPTLCSEDATARHGQAGYSHDEFTLANQSSVSEAAASDMSPSLASSEKAITTLGYSDRKHQKFHTDPSIVPVAPRWKEQIQHENQSSSEKELSGEISRIPTLCAEDATARHGQAGYSHGKFALANQSSASEPAPSDMSPSLASSEKAITTLGYSDRKHQKFHTDPSIVPVAPRQGLPKHHYRRCKEQKQHENQSSSEKELSGEISRIPTLCAEDATARHGQAGYSHGKFALANQSSVSEAAASDMSPSLASSEKAITTLGYSDRKHQKFHTDPSIVPVAPRPTGKKLPAWLAEKRVQAKREVTMPSDESKASSTISSRSEAALSHFPRSSSKANSRLRAFVLKGRVDSFKSTTLQDFSIIEGSDSDAHDESPLLSESDAEEEEDTELRE
eukprot:TRINITY_DN3007_c0_g1_i1.p1 TRINITY_DN3007_c0_g1~~TRINITY_DN3007_c0_g1_i1.p1  ORF type:complete len:454 (+),score=70.37 TRINITY_DN3007_c0_g1_i1:42-1364(+)